MSPETKDIKDPKTASLRPFKIIMLPISNSQTFQSETAMYMIRNYLDNRKVPCFNDYGFIRLDQLYNFYFGSSPIYKSSLPRICILFFDKNTYKDTKILIREIRQIAPDIRTSNILFVFILEKEMIDPLMGDGAIDYAIFVDPSIANQRDVSTQSSWFAGYLFKISQLLGLDKDLKTAHLGAIAENFADATLDQRPRLVINTEINENAIYPG